ncbi:calmodulin-binding receptor-like cytoplasmic kinase 2 isoform X2 [Beta vulgaris subsp. vulgaris]|uniref:calmodulin-binding receptor-like cytoplasmic kinase 2 isoform X2 n=1 Tax=Beta vulgaris subsp. vulgaris TaxID=3555 RepID=UPI0025473D06|nr:calmodulin-binding receptor-like cytoplasmic kinase 2 isoform X2 [Beta vulgaris subsp. vulgaris]
MKSNDSGTEEWSSDMAITDETLSHSPVSNTLAVSKSRRRSGNPVKYAAKAIAGVFIDCFTPPEDDDPPKSRKKKSNFQQLKSSSVSSGRSGSEKKHGAFPSYIPAVESDLRKGKFTMAQIYKATKNFDPSFRLGQGGFGTVYRGTLDDGTLVAVKRAKRSGYGNHLGAEFRTEIQTLAQVDHLNLVKCYGFLEEKDERLLVVEYVPNGTLREHLDCFRGEALDMAARLDIAIDIAHAITYLHVYTADRDSGITHVSTQVKGTAGYLDPEYLQTYQLTEKSDVYSFGVLLVELVTGRRPIENKRMMKERITARWAIMKLTEGDAKSTIDPRVEATIANVIAVEKILELALICLAPQRQNRPTMQRCAEILWSIRKDFRELLAADACPFSPSTQRSNSIGRATLHH